MMLELNIVSQPYTPGLIPSFPLLAAQLSGRGLGSFIASDVRVEMNVGVLGPRTPKVPGKIPHVSS